MCLGFVVAITEEKTKPDEPRTIVATQLPNVYSLPDDVKVSAEAYPKINWSYGPVKVSIQLQQSRILITAKAKAQETRHGKKRL